MDDYQQNTVYIEAMGGPGASKPAGITGLAGVSVTMLGCVGVRGRNIDGVGAGASQEGKGERGKEITTRNYRDFPFRDVLGLRLSRMPVAHFANCSLVPFSVLSTLFPSVCNRKRDGPRCANFWVARLCPSGRLISNQFHDNR